MLGVTVTSNTNFTDARAAGLAASVPRRWLQGVLRAIRDTWRRLAPHDTGAYQRSIYYRTYLTSEGLTGLVASSLPPERQNVIEYGRRPGSKMPPAGVLLPWMARHGIAPTAEFAVRRSIAKRGIPGQHPAERAYRLHKGLLATQLRSLESDFVRGFQGGD